MELVKFNCPSCNAPITSDRDRSFIFCQYCGTKVMLHDIECYKEDAKTERVQSVLSGLESMHNAHLAHKAEVKRLREEAKLELERVRKEEERLQREAEHQKRLADLKETGMMLLGVLGILLVGGIILILM